MQFKEYIVDEGNDKVFVRGTGRFIWTTTGDAWDECFVYLLDFVEGRDGWKVGRYQVWADSGAGEFSFCFERWRMWGSWADASVIAYLARIGELKKVQSGEGEELV